jgi:site-specific recombinase XerD
MDARTVLATWLDEHNPDRRGKEGRLLQGTSPDRYGEIVTDWLDFMEGLKLDPLKAQPSHVKTFLDSRGGAVRTRALRQSALSAFYTYAKHFGHAEHDPALAELRGRPQDEPETPKLSPGQMALLQWGADHLDGPYALRDRLFAYLQLASLRSRQITEFELPGVIFEQSGRMLGEVWQKGGGTRRYAFPTEVRDAVRAYLPHRTHRPPQSFEHKGPLLVSYRGNRLDPQTTPRAVWHQVLALARACPDPDAPELPSRVTPDMIALSPSPFGELERA